MENTTLIEIDAKDLATPKLEKLKGKLKDTSKSSGFLATAFSDLGAKAESMGIPIGNAQKYIGALGMGGVAAGAIAGIGAIAVGMGALSFSVIQSTADLKDFSDQTGLSVEQLSSMDLALKTSNVSTEQYSDAMTKLTINIGKSTQEFKKLGVSTNDPQKAFEQLRKKISETSDPIERARLGNMAFGKSFKDLMPLLRMTEQEFQNLKSASNVISTEDAEKAAELADKFDIMKAKIGGAATNIGLSMMPAMESLFKLMEKFIPVITGTLDVLGKLSSTFIDFASTLGSGAFTAIKKVVDLMEDLWNKAKGILGVTDQASKQKPGQYQTQTEKAQQAALAPSVAGFQLSQETKAKFAYVPPVEKPSVLTPPTDGEAKKPKLEGSAKDRYHESLGLNPYGMGNLLQSKQGDNKVSESEQKKIESLKEQSQEYADWLIELDNFVYEETTAIEEKKTEEASKRLEEHAEYIKTVWANVSQTLQTTLSAPFEGLFRAMSRGKADFTDFAKSIVDSFGNMLVQMAAKLAAYAVVFGVLNAISGPVASGGGFSLMKGLGFAANGSEYLPAGWTMVGERGPEMIYNDKPGSKVISNKDMKASGDKQMSIVNNFNVREVKTKEVVDGIDAYSRRYGRYGLSTVGSK